MLFFFSLSLSFFYFQSGAHYCICFVQALLYAQGILLVGLRKSYRVPGIKTELAKCKASTLYYLASPKANFLSYLNIKPS